MDGVSYGPDDIAAFIVFIGILIFVHEAGHFLAAKWFDIKVTKFSLGFGPPLIAFKRGETQYQIAAVPFGGYVKMVGDVPGDEIDPADRPRAFTTAPLHRRAIIALAGPIFNLVFPVICFFAYYLLGPTVVSPVIGQIEIGKPAASANLKPGDRVLSVGGERTWSFQRMADVIADHPGETLKMKVLREEKEIELEVTPMADSREDPFGAMETRGLIGVSPARAGTRIGVDDPALNAGRFVTGDRVISVDGKKVERAEDLQSAIKHAAGTTVEVIVARPQPLALGDLLLATTEMPEKLTVAVPANAEGIAALGLAMSDTFLRGVVPGGAADRAGLRPGDRVKAIDGTEISLFWSLESKLIQAQDKPLTLTIKRDGKEQDIKLVSKKVVRKHDVTGMDRDEYDSGLGIGPYPRNQETKHWSTSATQETEVAKLNVVEAFVASLRQTGTVIGLVTTGIFKLFTRQISTETLGGPIMLFHVAAQAAELGVFAYLSMLAWISVNLGLINLLPIPIFDGGHLLFVAIEAVRRKPMSMRAREAASIVGLVLLLALIVIAFRNDIMRLDLF